MRTNRGFTLLEILIAIAIIGILVAILLPVIHRAKIQARRAVCTSNLKQIYKGIMLYANDNNDEFPCVLTVESDIYGKRRIYAGLWPKYIPSAEVFVCPNDPLHGRESIRQPKPPYIPLSYWYLFFLNCMPDPAREEEKEPGIRAKLAWIRKQRARDPATVNLVLCLSEDSAYATGDQQRHEPWSLFLDGHVGWGNWEIEPQSPSEQ